MSVTTLIASIALITAIASLLVGVGNARRLNLVGVGRQRFEARRALQDGTSMPVVVRDAIGGASSAADFVLVVASGTCPACRSLAADLNHQRPQLGAHPIIIVDVSKDGEPTFSEFIDFKAIAIYDRTQVLQKALRAELIPYSFVVSNWRIVGHTLGSDIVSLTRLIGEAGVAGPTS